MDPFAGNNQDPQSLHKYLYAHANPINKMDLNGMFAFTAIGQVMVTGIQRVMHAIQVGLYFGATHQFATSVAAKMVLAGIALALVALAVYSHSFAPTVMVFVDKDMKPTTLYNPDREDIERQILTFKENETKLATFYVRSHADSETMYLGNGTFMQIYGGNLRLMDSGGSFDIGHELNDLLESRGTVILAGCNTGAGEDSLAAQVSRILPGRRVLGGKRYTFQVPLSESSFFIANIFQDGRKIGEDLGFHAP